MSPFAVKTKQCADADEYRAYTRLVSASTEACCQLVKPLSGRATQPA